MLSEFALDNWHSSHVSGFVNLTRCQDLVCSGRRRACAISVSYTHKIAFTRAHARSKRGIGLSLPVRASRVLISSRLQWARPQITAKMRCCWIVCLFERILRSWNHCMLHWWSILWLINWVTVHTHRATSCRHPCLLRVTREVHCEVICCLRRSSRKAQLMIIFLLHQSHIVIFEVLKLWNVRLKRRLHLRGHHRILSLANGLFYFLKFRDVGLQLFEQNKT